MGGAGLLVVEMGVGMEIRAVPGGATLKVDRADQVALDERLQAVVDRGQGDHRHLGLRPGKDLLRRRMVSPLEKDAVDDLALRGGAKAAVGQSLG